MCATFYKTQFMILHCEIIECHVFSENLGYAAIDS